MIPLFAVIVAVTCGLRRRYLFEHLVFATHLFTFFIIYMMASLPALIIILFAAKTAGLVGAMSPNTLDTFSAILIISGMIAYLYAACRRVYGGKLPVNL